MDPLFLERIQSYLPDEYQAFLDSFEQPLKKGLRINTKKIRLETFRNQSKIPWQQSPFDPNSTIVHESLGLHPFHICGAFYLQEPSASAPVFGLQIQGDEKVLDLCAAPGGKSTQIAQQLTTGFLVSNEIHPGRAKVLLSNMERLGLSNTAITNNTPQQIARACPQMFDKVLVDAPCSGEGMMHKHDQAVDQWSLDLILQCRQRQLEILEAAYTCLKPGGTLVYSTCTYAKEENEDVIKTFLDRHTDVSLMDFPADFGRPGFLEGTRRIFPMDGGEGQFMACLKKEGNTDLSWKEIKSVALPSFVKDFIREQIGEQDFHVIQIKDRLYMKRQPFYALKGCNVLRQGAELGVLKKNRLEPAHSFYLSADWISYWKRTVEVDTSQMDAFMHGGVLSMDSPKGYVAVCRHGIPFGFGKSDGHQIKNKIPKGLRLLEKSHIQE